MNLFRSEEHIARRPAGAGPVRRSRTTLADLAVAWWHDRLRPTGDRKRATRTRRSSTDLGLTAAFWRLPLEGSSRPPRRGGLSAAATCPKAEVHADQCAGRRGRAILVARTRPIASRTPPPNPIPTCSHSISTG